MEHHIAEAQRVGRRGDPDGGRTIRLGPGGPLHQVVGQLHGVGGAQGQVPGQADHHDAHQGVLQQGHLRAQPQEEAGGGDRRSFKHFIR